MQLRNSPMPKCLAAIEKGLGSLNRISASDQGIGMVKAVSSFPELSETINGASDLLTDIFGDAGRL